MGKICLLTMTSGEKRKSREDQLARLKVINYTRPDTELAIKTLAKHTSILRPYAESLYFELLQSAYYVEGAIQAEKEGFDAVVIGCYFDPGVDAAREVVNIPVVGLVEASVPFALMLARKRASLAVIAVATKGQLKSLDALEKYGFGPHLIPIKPVRMVETDIYQAACGSGKPEEVKRLLKRFTEVARGCIADGAEIIITGCGGMGPLLSMQGIKDIDGVPILDPVMCGIKMAENMIDLRKLGVNTSRVFMYKQPLPEDYVKERKAFGFG